MWCVVIALVLCFLPGRASAEWLRYNNATRLVTGYNATIPIAELAGHTLLQGTFVFPPVDGCPGQPDWTIVNVSPFRLDPRPGLSCFRGSLVTSAADVDAVVAQELDAIPVLARLRQIQDTTAIICASGPSPECTDSQTVEAAVQARVASRRGAIGALIRAAQSFKSAKGF